MSPKRDLVQRRAADGADAFDFLLVRGLDGFGKQLAERAEIRRRDGEHAGERAEADDIDPDQRPDQRIDTANTVEKTPGRETNERKRHDVSRGQRD